MRYFFLFLLSSVAFAHSPTDFSLASVYNEPPVFVEGKVNAITGEFLDLEEDLVIQGAEPIRIQRAYLNSSRKDWTFLPHVNANIDFSEILEHCTIRENTCVPIRYTQVSKTEKKGHSIYRYEPLDLEEGFSNHPSRPSLKNNFVIYDKDKNQLTLHTADGVERLYEKRRKNTDSDESWRLLSEHLPNGNWLIYDYIKTNTKYAGPTFTLTSIRSMNPSRTKQYAEARFVYEDLKHKNKHFFIEGSDGQQLEYRFNKRHGRQSEHLKEVLSDAYRPHQFYEYAKYRNTEDYWHFERHERVVKAIVSPQNGRLEIDYYFRRDETVDGAPVALIETDPPSGKLIDFIPDPRRGRVKTLSAPRGPDGQMIVIDSFFYDVKNYKTTVFDADKNRTEYFYNDQFRLQRIERFSANGNLLNAEQFVWAPKKSTDACSLLCKIFLDQSKIPIYAKRFFYDQKGNLIQEKSYGNLSGKGIPLTLNGSGFPLETGVETYEKEWRYSEGTPSLLLESKTEDGLRITYDYLPGTNLPIRKLTFSDGKITLRQFWVYNEDSLLIREVTDDGNEFGIDDKRGVAVRTVRDIHLRTEQPYLGMPETIEEKYWDGATEKLLQKTVLHYTKGGLIHKKDVYDSNGEFRYSLNTKYDPHGRPVKETNPLGLEADSQFDEGGNRTSFRDFGSRTEIFSSYDRANRLTEKTFKGFDGITQTFRYTYNKLNFLTSETDPNANTTTYLPNSFGQSTETHLPPILNQAGLPVSPVLRTEYDAAGNAIRRIDAENFATKISYNAYGSPIEITYPDQSKEHYEYFRNGLLKSHTDQTDVITAYERNPLGQITRQTISQSSRLLAEERFQYKGEKLTTKTDAEDHQTHYTYDGAGRKILEEFAGETTTFQYDNLGRNHIIEKGTIRTTLQFDLLGRVEETRQEDIATGQLLRKTRTYYDSANNPIEICNWTSEENQLSSQKLDYDSLNRPTSHIDALGNQETTSYNGTIQKTHIDPKGLETTEQFDAHGRLTSIEKHKDNQLLFSEQKFYSPRGLLTLQSNTIFNPDGTSRTVQTKWEYDSMGRLVKLTEADNKITKYTYTARGELKTATKPSGTVLTHDYNGLGYLEHLASSDGTVNHQMRYNKLGSLIWMDGNDRKVDAHQRLISEEFPTGLRIENTYNTDGLRSTCKIEPANCLIEYTYQGQDMAKVTRKTLKESPLYTHTYLRRDLSGNLLHAKLLDDLGTLRFDYDLNSRIKGIYSPKFSQEVLARDPCSNILQMKTQENTTSFTYDALSQLTSEQGYHYENDTLSCRLKKNDETYTINPLHQAISHIEYDRNGLPQMQQETRYTFDALDRLIHLETPLCIQTFQYDALNRRLSSTTTRPNTQENLYFLYDGHKEIGAFDEQLTPTQLRILGETPHAEIGATIALELHNQIYAPIHDLSGNIATLLSTNTGQTTHYRYTAYGEEAINGPIKSPWRFASKRTDETGLVYYGHRYYQPELGRWLTPDPAGFVDGMNLYAFVHNNPINRFDEYGLLDFGQYEPDYREQTLDTWSQLTTPLAHGIITASEYAAYTTLEDRTFEAAFEQTRNNYINTISHTSTNAHAWVDNHRHEIADFASKSTGAALGTSIATRSIAPLYQEAKFAIQAAKTANTTPHLSSPTFKSTPIPEKIHRVNPTFSTPYRPATSSVTNQLLKNKLIAQEISGGHAFEKHILNQGEFPGWIRTRQQFAQHIEYVINNPTKFRELSFNRRAYWHEGTRTVVVRNPKALDGGTSFQPLQGIEYFEKRLN